MRKIITLFLALSLTAGLVYALRWASLPSDDKNEKTPPLIRVWITEKEPGLNRWLRWQASAWEKKTGIRVYLRAASSLDAENGAPLPDLMISETGNEPVAMKGFALILRDESAARMTPLPTSALFFKPTPSPGPSPTPGSTPDVVSFAGALCPETLAGKMPEAVKSEAPLRDFLLGKSDAALLTADQAGEVTMGFRAFPVPDGKGFVSFFAAAQSAQGRMFLDFLLSDAGQLALREAGLYSPRLLLYRGEGAIREMIDSSRKSGGSE